MKTKPLDPKELKLVCLNCKHEFTFDQLVIIKRRGTCPECNSLQYEVDSYRGDKKWQRKN